MRFSHDYLWKLLLCFMLLCAGTLKTHFGLWLCLWPNIVKELSIFKSGSVCVLWCKVRRPIQSLEGRNWSSFRIFIRWKMKFRNFIILTAVHHYRTLRIDFENTFWKEMTGSWIYCNGVYIQTQILSLLEYLISCQLLKKESVLYGVTEQVCERMSFVVTTVHGDN